MPNFVTYLRFHPVKHRHRETKWPIGNKWKKELLIATVKEHIQHMISKVNQLNPTSYNFVLTLAID